MKTPLQEEIEKLSNTGELHEFIRLETGNYMIDMSEVCELAHEYTVEECKRKGIKKIEEVKENGDINYTEEVQDIFKEHLDLITNTFSI